MIKDYCSLLTAGCTLLLKECFGRAIDSLAALLKPPCLAASSVIVLRNSERIFCSFKKHENPAFWYTMRKALELSH